MLRHGGNQTTETKNGHLSKAQVIARVRIILSVGRKTTPWRTWGLCAPDHQPSGTRCTWPGSRRLRNSFLPMKHDLRGHATRSPDTGPPNTRRARPEPESDRSMRRNREPQSLMDGLDAGVNWHGRVLRTTWKLRMRLNVIHSPTWGSPVRTERAKGSRR